MEQGGVHWKVKVGTLSRETTLDGTHFFKG